MASSQFRGLSLRVGMLGLLPVLALFLGSVARPSVAMVMATNLAVVTFAMIALGTARWLPPEWRRSAVAFAVVSVGSLYLVASALPSFTAQWESRNGPGMEEVSVFRTQSYEEFSSVVIVPFIALPLGIAAALAARVLAPLPSPPLILVVLAALVILVIYLIMMPTTQ